MSGNVVEQETIVREAPFPVTRLVYLLASSETCCSLKDLDKTAKRQTKLGSPASRP